MALSSTGKLIAAGALVAGVVGLSLAASRAKREKIAAQKKAAPKEPALEGVYSMGTRLPERVVNDVVLPIEFLFAPRTMRLEGEIVEGSPTIEDKTQLANLVTDMTHERANIAYEYLSYLIGNEGYDLSNVAMLDEAVQKTATVVAPRVDWSQGLIYAYDSPEGYVWRGIQLLGELAHQSFWNKRALA